MIVDSSAIIAIALSEPEAPRFAAAIAAAPDRFISAINWLETLMVIESRVDATAADEALLILHELSIKPLAFDETHAHEAREAWQRYGKGRHAAGLNLGDCCAYAASKVENRPLLFKGNDFAKTDVEKAVY